MACIYGLFDKRNAGEIRYVGMTVKTGERRLAEHWSSVKKGEHTHKASWMRKVGEHHVGVRVLQSAPRSLSSAEVRWIRKLRRDGHRLTNLTDGGEGPLGRKCSPATRAALIRYNKSTKARARLAARNRKLNTGTKQSAERVEKRIAPLRGRKRPPATRAKISAGLKASKRYAR